MKNYSKVKQSKNEFDEICHDEQILAQSDHTQNFESSDENRLAQQLESILSSEEMNNVKPKEIALKLERLFENSRIANFEYYFKTGRKVFRCNHNLHEEGSAAIASFLKKLLQKMNKDVIFIKESKYQITLIFR